MAEGFQGLIKVDWIVTNATYDIAKANLLEAVKNAVVNWQRLICGESVPLPVDLPASI